MKLHFSKVVCSDVGLSPGLSAKMNEFTIRTIFQVEHEETRKTCFSYSSSFQKIDIAAAAEELRLLIDQLLLEAGKKITDIHYKVFVNLNLH